MIKIVIENIKTLHTFTYSLKEFVSRNNVEDTSTALSGMVHIRNNSMDFDYIY